ncbi:MAG: hypothetical protein ACYCY6_01080 [Minisyncoccota bacterium]
MPKSRIILVTGFFIALLPVLGFPPAWESFFQVAGGLGIVLLSVLISIDKRLTQKAKAERRNMKKRVRVEEEVEPSQISNEEFGAQ